MANKKFSEFELKTTTSNVSHVVGYDGVENVRITPANFLDTTGGPYLPLAGGLMVGNTTHNDNVKSIYGDGGDLEIYHSGAASYIVDNGTGNLDIRADSLSLLNAAGNEYYARFYTNGAAYLYNNGVAKFYTTGTGAEVIGDLVVTGTITGVGGSYLPLAGGTLTGALTGTTAIFEASINSTAPSTDSNNLLLIENTNATGSCNIRLRGGDGATRIMFGKNSTPNDKLFITPRANETNHIVVDGSGNLGLGTSSPNSYAGQTALTINSSGVARLDLDISDTNQGYLLSESGYAGLFASTGNNLRFGSNGTEKMRLDASGNLLLGTLTTTYDAAKIGSGHRFLNVQAPLNQYAVGTLAGNSATNGNRLGYLTFVNENNSASYKYSAWMGSEVEGTTANQQGGRLVFATADDGSSGGPAERMRLNNSSLQLTTGAANQGILQLSSDASYQIRGGGNYGYLSLIAPVLRFDTNGSERMRLDASGNLGLGQTTMLNTATGRAALTVGGSVSGILSFGNAGTQWGGFYGSVDEISLFGNNYVKFSSGASNTERMRITSGGQVLIGATSGVSSPAAKLEVNGDLQVNEGLYGKNYPQTSTLTNTSVVDTGIIPNAGVYEFNVMGNPNSAGSSTYRSIVSGLITISVDFISSVVSLRVATVVLAQQGGGSGNTQLTVNAFLQGNGSAALVKPYSQLATEQIRILVGGYTAAVGGQSCRITRKL